MAQLQNPPRDLSPHLVLVRFGVRITILMTFALLGSSGFGKSLAALSAMAAILCTLVATVRRETIFQRAFNHWDEAAAFAALHFLCVGLGFSPPI